MENSEFSQLDELLLKHVGLVSAPLYANLEGISLQGPIKVKNIWFHVKLICPNYPRLECLQLQIQQGYNIKTLSHKNANINLEWSVDDLLENILSLIKNLDNSLDIVEDNIIYERNLTHNVYAEIAGLYAPSEYEMQTNESCTQVRFCKFSQNEQHYLEVALPTLKLVAHSLPDCIDWQDFLSKASSLAGLLQQYRKYLEDLRPFYENFADIDELCHVVQPTLPTTKKNWRLFVLKERVFLKLQFSDPFSPLGSMTVHIIGPTSEVSQLRRIYSEGLRNWDGELDVHKNLLRIFDLCYFPMAPANDLALSLQFCNICYSYKLDHGEIPIISCDNAQCCLIYHAECLKEWFSTLADGKTFLDVAFGVCPFCKAKLSTSFQEILQ